MTLAGMDEKNSGTAAARDATPPALGLRAQKKERARDAMHRAAVGLAAELGASSVTVEMIADAADVSPRTFFNYWESKEAAILGLTPDRTDRAVDLLRERPVGERPEASLRAVVRQMAAQMPTDLELRRTKRLAMDREPALRLASGRVMSSLHEALTTALAERLDGEDARDRATVLVQLAFGAAHAAFALSLTHGTTLSAEFDRIYDLIDRGVVGI